MAIVVSSTDGGGPIVVQQAACAAESAPGDVQPRSVRRVLLVLQTTKVGGMETHCLDLAAEYVRRGVAVVVVLPLSNAFDALARAFRERGARVMRLASDAREGRTRQIGDLARLLRLMRVWRPQAVHLHTGGATGGAAVLALARAAGATTVITEHDVPGPDASRKDRLARRAVDGLAHAVVAVSNRNAGVRAERLGRRPSRGAIVLNGVPIPATAANERLRGREQVRNALGIAPQTVLIGCVVRLAEGKGLDTLLRAFALTRARTPCSLLLVGDGPLRSELEALAAELGVHDAVYFAGHQADPVPWYDALDVFALAVPAGSMSIALLEALARGLPSVITFWNPDEALVPEVTGLSAPPNDPPALATALTRLAADADLRASLGTTAADYVARRYSVARVTSDLLDLYSAAKRGIPPALTPVQASAARDRTAASPV
jgi:glycosyltransferase involved in cell wall biosynthesis